MSSNPDRVDNNANVKVEPDIVTKTSADTEAPSSGENSAEELDTANGNSTSVHVNGEVDLDLKNDVKTNDKPDINGLKRHLSDSDTDSDDSTQILEEEDTDSEDEKVDENLREKIGKRPSENSDENLNEKEDPQADENSSQKSEDKLEQLTDSNVDERIQEDDKNVKAAQTDLDDVPDAAGNVVNEAKENSDTASSEDNSEFKVDRTKRTSVASCHSDIQTSPDVELNEIQKNKPKKRSSLNSCHSDTANNGSIIIPVTMATSPDPETGDKVLDENENRGSAPRPSPGGATTENNNLTLGKSPAEFQEVALGSQDSPAEQDEKDTLQVPGRDVEKGRDDPDGMSVYSLYMIPDLRFYFQHPYARLFIAYLITLLNFYMFAEDPIAHSKAEATIPVLGNCFCFVFRKYPPNGWSFLKVLMWVSAIVAGCVLGKKVVHQILLQRVLRLKMFAEDQGSWLVMAATTLMVVFITSWVYNLILLAGGESTEPYRIDAYLGFSNGTFTRIAATGTWSGDFITAWIVTDMMLQDKLYPKWNRWVRSWWSIGYKRIFIFWGVTFAAFFIVMLVIATDWINWDTLNAKFVATNEASRAFLASFILVMDLIIVMQDWDFPHFINVLDIKLPGLNTANVKFQLPKKWEVHITGKWMNYGIIVIVMLLDLNMWQTQMFYSPFKYAQYTGPDGRIYSVRDEASMSHNETLMNYEWRSNNTDPLTNQTYVMGDHVTNSKKLDYGLGVTCLAFIPSITAFCAFIFFIAYFGREKPTKEDPHAGRLMKRKKKRSRFSFKKFRRSFSRRKPRGIRDKSSYSPQEAAAAYTSEA